MNKDKLDKIFEKQKLLQNNLVGNPTKLVMNQEYININILACLDELSEVLRETQWKNPDKIKYGWKKTQEFNQENFKKEIIDLGHFYINLCIASGMDSNELFDRYIEKNKENHQRKKRGY